MHEEHLAACKMRLETMLPILKMFDRRAFILSEDAAMKEALTDPNRLLGRGRGMAEQLKKEEKVRNMVNKELPKLREKLRVAIVEYESSVGLNLKVCCTNTFFEKKSVGLNLKVWSMNAQSA